MSIEDVFANLGKHMVEGLMVHSKLADYYGFLGLEGYCICHEYHYYSENSNYRKLSNYYLHHYGKIINEMPFENPNIIPDTWKNHKRFDVSVSTRKVAIQTGMEKWVTWEKNTKRLYESMYNELVQVGDIAGAILVGEFIKDVDYELAEAEQMWIEKGAMEYSVNDIMMEQKDIEKTYRKKFKEIELC